MRAYSIALFFLCLQIASAIISLSGVFMISSPVDTTALSHLNNTMSSRTYMNGTTVNYNAEFERSGVGDTLETLGKALNVKHTLMTLGLVEGLATLISYLVYFVYVLGIVQLVLIRKGIGDVS